MTTPEDADRVLAEALQWLTTAQRRLRTITDRNADQTPARAARDAIGDIEAASAILAARGWRLVPEPLPREALEAMRQVHARHDLGHKVGAWANACALCEAYRSVAALSPDRPTPQ